MWYSNKTLTTEAEKSMKLAMKKSTETYLEQNAIELSYFSIIDEHGNVIGKMKADYKTMTLRTFSGVVKIGEMEISVSGKKSMKEVLAHFEDLCFNTSVTSTVESTESIVA